MKELVNIKSVWIIGASTGIGRAMVDVLKQPGRTLFISARDEAALSRIAKADESIIVPLPLDVTQEDSVREAANKIQQQCGGIDAVIVNAGTCEYLDGPEIDMALVNRVFNTNFGGSLNVIKHAIPLLRTSTLLQGNIESLKKSQQPKLVVVSSSVTYQALPRAGAYGGSKAALRYFTECLKLDLQHEQIDVRLVSPGFVKTPLTDRNDFDMPFLISAEQAAERMVKGLCSGRFDIQFPLRFTLILKLIGLLPDTLRFKLVGRLSRHSEAYATSKL